MQGLLLKLGLLDTVKNGVGFKTGLVGTAVFPKTGLVNFFLDLF
jgi:hypothetical protein